MEKQVLNRCVTFPTKIWKWVFAKRTFNVQSLQDIMATERMQHGEVNICNRINTTPEGIRKNEYTYASKYRS